MSPIRRSVLAAAGAPLFSAAGRAASPDSAPRCDPVSDQEVGSVVRRAEQAHEALMRGDLTRYRSLISYTDDFTLMTPFGGKPSRAASLTDDVWAAIGRFFKNGRDSRLELVQAYRSTDLIVVAAIERTHVEVGNIPAQDWALRVTLVFRKEKGQWLLAHRHADALAGGISVEHAAALARGSSGS
jgi:ketosteroid isomerase-like protein